jgi:hypothetical protein
MFRYLLVDQAVPAMCRRLAAARLSANCPSGNAPTTRVRRLISRRMRSSGLLTGMMLAVSGSSGWGRSGPDVWCDHPGRGAPGARKVGRPIYDELRARVVSWPPPRPARLR